VDAFNGRTGAVTLLDADMPARLSETSLNATILAQGATAFAPVSGALTLTAKQTLDTREAMALRQFRVALMTRETRTCNVLNIGDSITAGYLASTLAKRWASLFRDQLRAAFPQTAVGGFGYMKPAPYMRWNGIYSDNPSVVAAPGTTTGTGYGVDGETRILTGAGAQVVWTFTGTAITFSHAIYSGGGALEYFIDGNAPTSVSTNGATNNSALVNITGLSAASHTLTVRWASGGSVFVNGAFVMNGDETKGIRSWVAARSGSASSFWWNVAANYWMDRMDWVKPDLVTIELGANDFSAVTPNSVATFKANLKNIIARIKLKTIGHIPSFVLMPVWNLAPGSGGSSSIDTWANYIKAMYEAAAEDTDGAVCVFDLFWRVNPNAPSTAGGLLGGSEIPGDYTHLNDVGEAYVASALLEFVRPR
jgi:lysophospholipase L1-like esterase